MASINRDSNSRVLSIVWIARRCALLWVLLDIATTFNGSWVSRSTYGSPSFMFVAADGATCKDKAITIRTNKIKEISFCKWVGKQKETRCKEKKHRVKRKFVIKKNGEKKVKWRRKRLSALKYCECACKDYITTGTGDEDEGEDGCPNYDFVKDVATPPVCPTEKNLKVCDYRFKYIGCTFEVIQCVATYSCQCFDEKWHCGLLHYEGQDCEEDDPRDPRRTSGMPGTRRMRWLNDDGVPTGDTCDPDDPLPKPPQEDSSALEDEEEDIVIPM